MNKLLEYGLTSVSLKKTTYHTVSLKETTYHTVSLEETTYHTISPRETTYYTISSKEITHHAFSKGEYKYKTTHPSGFLEEECSITTSSFSLTSMIIILFIMLV